MTSPTLSGLSLLAACPGSGSLPRQRTEGLHRSPIGHAIHEVCAARTEGGDGGDIPSLWADMLAPDDAGRLAFLAEHLRLPVPPGALAEVPLGLFPDGSVRRIEGGAGRYPDVGQVLSGTLDAMWAEPYPLRIYAAAGAMPEHIECPPASTLWVPDWKTGNEDNVPPPDRNWQLRAGALLAARWTGATRVITAICYVNAAECAVAVREGRPYEGRWECGAPLDAAALDAIEVELRAVLRAARGESDERGVCSVRRDDGRAAVDSVRGSESPGVESDDAGASPMVRAPLILGPHCDHCPARGACPALAAEAVSLATGTGLYLPPGRTLTREAASYLAGMLPAFERMVDAAKVGLAAHVRAFGPVRLADGREYGPHLEAVTTYDTGTAFDALSAVVGEEAARGAFRTSGEAMKDALAEAGVARGAWGRLRAKIEAAGGVKVTAREVMKRRWPAKPVEVEDGGDEERPDQPRALHVAPVGGGLLHDRGGVRLQPGERDQVRVASGSENGVPVGGSAEGAEVPGPGDRASHQGAGGAAVTPKSPRANPLPATWTPGAGVALSLAGRTPPLDALTLMPAYRAAMAGQTAGRWTDRRFLRWVDEQTRALVGQLAIEGAT